MSDCVTAVVGEWQTAQCTFHSIRCGAPAAQSVPRARWPRRRGFSLADSVWPLLPPAWDGPQIWSRIRRGSVSWPHLEGGDQSGWKGASTTPSASLSPTSTRYGPLCVSSDTNRTWRVGACALHLMYISYHIQNTDLCYCPSQSTIVLEMKRATDTASLWDTA